MRTPLIPLILAAGSLAGCMGQSTVKPVQALDEQTGVTVSALKSPLELVTSAQSAALNFGKRPTFAYLGPVEWDRSGSLSYGLWIHVSPGNERQPGDIRASDAVALTLDDGPLVLTPIEAPQLGRDPYRPAVSWGQTAYFDLSVATLKRMAASRKLELEVRAVDGSTLSFTPTLDAHAALTQYLHDRGLTGD
ncbi:MAG: hypothetical protein WBF89_07900 [Steroidobacteraceae bacterium]